MTSPALAHFARRCRRVVVTRTDMGATITDEHIAPRATHRSEDPEAVDLTVALREQPPDQLPWPIIHEESHKIIDGEMVIEALADQFSEFEVLLFSGSLLEAAQFAMALDDRSGRRRTKADRRAAAQAMLEHDLSIPDEWLTTTYRLANRTIAELRSRVQVARGLGPTPRVGKDGVTRVPPNVSLRRVVDHLRGHPDDDRPDTQIAAELSVTRSTLRLARKRLEQAEEERAAAEAAAEAAAAVPPVRSTSEPGSIQALFAEAAGALAAFLAAHDALSPDDEKRWYAPLALPKFEAAVADSFRFNRIARNVVKAGTPVGPLF